MPSDRQAAEAVRSRIDWKYALSLDLAAPRAVSLPVRERRNGFSEDKADMPLSIKFGRLHIV